MEKNKVRFYREKMGLSQAELADKAHLSIRTIQRIESGDYVLKGFTLRSLLTVLNLESDALFEPESLVSAAEIKTKIKLLNISTFGLLLFPFGNIILPLILWNRYRKIHAEIDDAGRELINFQIFWWLVMSCAMIISPLVLGLFDLRFPLILYIFFAAVAINLAVIFKTAVSIHRGKVEPFKLPIKVL